MGGQPSPRDPAKDYQAGINVYLRNYQKLIAAENAARAGNDPARVQEQLDLEKQFDPNRTAIRDAQSSAILSDLQGGYGLPPGLARETEQSIRGAQAARGNSYGNAPISAEALYKGKLAYDIHNRSLANAGTLLSTPSISTPDRTAQYTAGGAGAGAMGVNFGQMQYQQQANTPNPWASALSGSIQGGTTGYQLSGGNPYGAAAGALIGAGVGYFSDRRLKHDIERVGTSAQGYGIYHFSYNDSADRYEGTMADDAEKINPASVSMVGDYKMVNYLLTDVEFRKL